MTSATPMKLEDILSMNGYTISVEEFTGKVISTSEGNIVIPPMLISKLNYVRDGVPPLNAACYLDKLPTFHPEYAPIQLSNIIDRFRMRRISYNTPDEFSLAVRRWGNVNLGPFSVISQRYLSAAVDLPLDNLNVLVKSMVNANESSEVNREGANTSTGSSNVQSTDSNEATVKARQAQSDFPMNQLSGSGDYASSAVDNVSDNNVTGSGSTSGSNTSSDESTSKDRATGVKATEETRTEVGRTGVSSMQLLAEKRALFINADEEFLDAFESLFLGVWDRTETQHNYPGAPRFGGIGW